MFVVNLKIINYRFASYILAPFLFNSNLYANQYLNKIDLGTNLNNQEYILGSGDILQIDFKGIDIFNGNYVIRPNGFISLPEVGKVSAKDKTIPELDNILEKAYSEFLYNPKIDLTIINYRPLEITLRGEVNRTGLFNMYYNKKTLNKNNSQIPKSTINTNLGNKSKNSIVNESSVSVPKLFDLLKFGDGVTRYADLRNIEIIRRNPEIKGGGFIKTKVNVISLLESGDQSVNIVLRDGDDVFVPKSKKMLLEQLLEINKSNLTPDFINIFINGNIKKPGQIILKQGISLNEAIAAVGGKNSMTGAIEFIRFNKDGKTEKRIINIKNGEKGSLNNPILVSGDIIFVRKNLLGKATNVITEYTAPLVNAYGVYKIFD